ncbi:hypothetical protein C3445_26645, partial [Escherichia coli]|uniref:hypothetical protein n=1 Tax=Escherichia coli TaxID=562 RepID=UPI000FECF0FA
RRVLALICVGGQCAPPTELQTKSRSEEATGEPQAIQLAAYDAAVEVEIRCSRGRTPQSDVT